MSRAWLWMSVVVLACSGCSKSRDGGGGGGGDVPIDALDEATVAAYCDFLFSCDVGNDDTVGVKLLLRDAATCEDFLGRILPGSELGALQDAVASGRVVYDAAAAGRCLDAIRGSCSAAVSGSDLGEDDCDAAFMGTVAEGGECWFDGECAGDLGCDFGAGTCPGTCAPAGSTGFLCGDASCRDDQECFFPASGTERCVTEILQADASEGQPCGLVEEGTDTVTRRACASGLWCTGDSYSIGTCRAPIAAGAACASSDEICVEGHICAGGSCREVTVVRTPGGPCGEATLAFCDPLLRLECQAGACVEIGDGSTGSPCNGGDFGEFTCNEGLACHRDTMTCGAPKAAGAPCQADGECASSSCDHTAMTCRDRYCAA